MLAGVEDDIKKDLDMRAKAVEELPRPTNLRAPGMLDARFTVSYKNAVPTAMKLLTDYFAAYNDRDLKAVAQTLHFPFATFETHEPTVYMTAEDFIRNPPPSIHESTGPDSRLRPGTCDIMDTLQLQTYNPVNVGLELSYTRYRGDGYKLGINQGIYAITNKDGKWGIQLSSVIFTPTEYIGDKFNDAAEARLREGRTGMAAFGDHDYDLLQLSGPTASRAGSLNWRAAAWAITDIRRTWQNPGCSMQGRRKRMRSADTSAIQTTMSSYPKPAA